MTYWRNNRRSLRRLMIEVCTTAHDAAKADPDRWRALPLVGVQQTAEGPMELRNCPVCLSTLALKKESIDDAA